MKAEEICRWQGICNNIYPNGSLNIYGGVGIPDVLQLKGLEDENSSMQRIVTEQVLDIYNELLRLSADRSTFGWKSGQIVRQATAHFSMGNIFLAQGKAPEAAREYKATLEIRPDHDKAYNNLGIGYSTTGQYPGAIEAFNRAIQLTPHNADARRTLAICIRNADASRKN